MPSQRLQQIAQERSLEQTALQPCFKQPYAAASPTTYPSDFEKEWPSVSSGDVWGGSGGDALRELPYFRAMVLVQEPYEWTVRLSLT